jgi:hypothetical protein
MAVRPSIIKRDKHQQMLDEMHSALSSLGDLVRTPFPHEGDKLLPTAVHPAMPGADQAKKHIETLHKAFKSVKGGKEK